MSILNIISGYLCLVGAWIEHTRGRKFWYWWCISWALINFGVATWSNL